MALSIRPASTRAQPLDPAVHQSAASESDHPHPPTPVVGSLRLEELLVLPRLLVGLAVMAATFLVPGVSAPALVGVGIYFCLVALVAHRMIATASEHDRGPFLWTSVADTVGCFAALAVLGATPHAPGVLLFPLLAFELGLKHCIRGGALGLSMLTVAIAARLGYRSGHFGEVPRVWLILLMFAVTGLLLGLAGLLRSNEKARMQAVDDRRRLEQLLRRTVAGVLDEAGVSVSRARREDLLSLVDAAGAHPELGSEITRRLAEAVTPPAPANPLSARETEVLGLVASGLKDREIAARLFLSAGTVRVHMSNIVHKLEVADRAAAVRWYQEQDSQA